jgi:hypothetical protein
LTLPLRHADARFGIVVGVLRDEVLLEELLVHPLRLGGHGELGLRRFECSIPLDELRFEIGGVDAREQLAGTHGFAFPHRHFAHIARHLGLDGRLPQRLHRARHRQPAGHRLRVHPGEIGLRELQHDHFRALSAGGVLDLLTTRIADGAADGPDITSAIAAPTTRCPSPLCHALLP